MEKYKVTIRFDVDRGPEHYDLDYEVHKEKLKYLVKKEMEDPESLIINIEEVFYTVEVKAL